MTAFRLADIIVLRLRSLFRKEVTERDLERELTFHLEQQVAENMARGMPEQESQLAARRSLGGRAQVEEECRDMRSTNHVETV